MLKAMDIICGPPEAAGLTFLLAKRHSNDVTYIEREIESAV